MKRRKKATKRKIMGHNVFVPLNDKIEISITPNFYTRTCKWCGDQFNTFRPDAQYCKYTHRNAASLTRSRTKDLEKEVAELKAKVSEYERHG